MKTERVLKQLKYKLAREHLDEYPLMTKEEQQVRGLGFVAGFEKARQMAIQEYRKTSRKLFIERLESLGEEDVT